jgi:hypothetical protein
MLRRVALVRTDVSEELSASIIRVTRIGELETMLAVTSNRRTHLKSYIIKNKAQAYLFALYISTATLKRKRDLVDCDLK